MNSEKDIQDELIQSFGICLPVLVSKESLIAALAFRIDQLLEGNPDQLFSMLYRLDIAERKIKSAMVDEHGFSTCIAHLIYERQAEKVLSRQKHKGTKPDDELAW